MINDFLRNICLISFALIGPITLPAGGIQHNLNECKFLHNSKEIILSSNCSLYPFPNINAKKLVTIDSGNTLLILRKWKQKEIWLRVEIVSNQVIDNPNKVFKGWIKI